ncbi:MAG: hypothetical protein PHH85_02115 [Candidatus Methanoperedens sp.]|nr:hypothetical protein [Candidatus Methanoperedens sp.]
MTVLSLTEGVHTIRWTLAGYNTLEAQVSVSPTGAVTCLSVTGGNCSSITPPGIVVSGSTVTGYLKQAVAAGICGWVTDKGGATGLSVPEVLELVDAYLGIKNLGFTPTNQQIMGCVDYYLGFISSGNSKTGCGF